MRKGFMDQYYLTFSLKLVDQVVMPNVEPASRTSWSLDSTLETTDMQSITVNSSGSVPVIKCPGFSGPQGPQFCACHLFR